MIDPELAAIAAELRKTAGYAVNPQFKEQLRSELLADFRRYHSRLAEDEKTVILEKREEMR